MATKKSVFGSKSEQDLFRSITSRWGERFRIYPSLPFANVVDISAINLKHEERNFLLKTSVDFTICTPKQGRPLLSIDFDGMCHGLTRNGHYVPVRRSADPYRELKLELKVRTATQADYPLFVVSYDEKQPIGSEIHLSIVDGIIGLVLARKQFDYDIGQMERAYADYFPEETYINWDRVHEAVIDAECDAHFKWNPITRAQAELNFQAWSRGVVKSYETEFLTEPPLPTSSSESFTREAVAETAMRRAEAVEDARRVGCRAIIHTPFGDITEIAWIRNLQHAGVSALSLVEEIALLLAFKRVVTLSEPV